MIKRVASGLGVALAMAVLAGCVTPALNDSSYEKKAALSAESAISDVASARLAVRTWLDDRIAGTYLEVVVVDAESSIGAVSDTFGSVEAPDSAASNDLRKRTTDALSAAEDALTALRIAVRQSDRAGVEKAQQALDKAAAALDQIAGQ